MDEDKSQAPKTDATETDTPGADSAAPKKTGFMSRFGSKKLWLVILPLVLLAGGLLAMTYFHQQKAMRIDELNDEVSLLQQAVADKDSQLAELQTDEGDAEETDADTTDPCESGSAYTADVGNFTATLDDPFVIIRELDAGFEGGPATRLSTASCIDGETNVFDSPYQRDVNILANPQSSAADLRSAYESNSGPLTADGTRDVSGVTADKYTQDALFETTVLFFDRDGIGYQIEASGTPGEFNPLLTDLVEDWEWES